MYGDAITDDLCLSSEFAGLMQWATVVMLHIRVFEHAQITQSDKAEEVERDLLKECPEA